MDTTTARRPMIYGFVVDPALRGRGHGRSMMYAVLDLLRDRAAEAVGLEVVTTYRYLRIPAMR